MNPWNDIGLGTIIAERQLFLDGQPAVSVQIGMPRTTDQTPYSESACPWLIEGLGSGKLRYAVGIDTLQSLVLALQTIGTTLYASAEYKAGRLRAFADGDDHGDLGFPVTPGYEDLVRSNGQG